MAELMREAELWPGVRIGVGVLLEFSIARTGPSALMRAADLGSDRTRRLPNTPPCGEVLCRTFEVSL